MSFSSGPSRSRSGSTSGSAALTAATNATASAAAAAAVTKPKASTGSAAQKSPPSSSTSLTSKLASAFNKFTVSVNGSSSSSNGKPSANAAAVKKSGSKENMNHKSSVDQAATPMKPSAAATAAAAAAAAAATGHSSISPATAQRRRLSVTSTHADVGVIDGVAQPLSLLATPTATGSNNSNNSDDPLVRSRRKLSVFGDLMIDGASAAGEEHRHSVTNSNNNNNNNSSLTPITVTPTPAAATPAPRLSHTAFASLSKTGFVPFNPHKVNQDRCCEVVRVNNSSSSSIFAVYDGHGAIGHHVSEYCKHELHKTIAAQSNLLTAPVAALRHAFLHCHDRLIHSGINCEFSGTTVILIYINNNTIYSCNAGDSRAVLCQQSTAGGAITAVALSADHKPDVDSERARILAHGGRVEACKGNDGESIGPLRVWIAEADVPGLAMTRSFGDMCAQRVGVSHDPEIWTHSINTATDKFIVLASDGIFEFMSNEEVIAIADKEATPEAACRRLVEEATHRWHMEEEVVDDCSCIVIML